MLRKREDGLYYKIEVSCFLSSHLNSLERIGEYTLSVKIKFCKLIVCLSLLDMTLIYDYDKKK